MRPLVIVATHGASRSGKDTALKVLGKQLEAADIEYFQLDFAKHLRAATCELLGVTPLKLADSHYRRKPQPILGGQTPVDVMRKLGTEFMRRTFNDNYWADKFFEAVEEERRVRESIVAVTGVIDPLVLLVSDTRFRNEVFALHQHPNCKVHHITVLNPNVEFSDHASDDMNRRWIVEGRSPDRAMSKTASIQRFINDTSLKAYEQQVAKWGKEFCLQLQSL